MSQELGIVLYILIAVIGGGFVLFCGYALSGGGSTFPKCDGKCGTPFDYYYSIQDGKKYCRGCAERLGLRAWYAKQLPNGEWLE